METMLDAFFTDRSSTGLISLLDTVGVVEYYFDPLENGTYVSLPSLFVIQECGSAVHTHETIKLVFERLRIRKTRGEK
jgi:hypothetical protein